MSTEPIACLIIEDKCTYPEYFKALLENNGINVQIVCNSDEAEKFCIDHKIDLVFKITDIKQK